MKTLALLGILTCAAMSSTLAHADRPSAPAAGTVDTPACLTAVSKGQRLRDTHKLVEAREQFRICARTECPAVVQNDCTTWLAELDRTIPTVVLSAKDSTGTYVVDAKVSVDGQPLVSKLDGQAVAVDPGLHTFRFERSDGSAGAQQMVIKEGEKAQTASVVLSNAGGGAAPTPEPAPAGPTGEGGGAALASPESASTPGSTARLLGLLLGGVGVVGMGVGVGIALDAKSKDNQAANDPPSSTRQADSQSAVNEGNVATVVLGVGAALAVAGVVVWLTAPSATAGGSSESARDLRSLAVATDGREVVLLGTF